jgi:RHS repeat-associated protein
MLAGSIIEYDELYQYFHDGLGSITMICDSTGEYQNLYVYDDFGNFRMMEEAGSVPNHYYYTGQERDESPSGLYNLRARYYAAGIGRFTQEDPYYSFSGMGGSSSCYGCLLGVTRVLVDDPRYVNFYTYSLNSPMNYSDITGLSPDGYWNPCEAWDECLEGVGTRLDTRLEQISKSLHDCIESIDFCKNPEKLDKCLADFRRSWDDAYKAADLGARRCNKKYGWQCTIYDILDWWPFWGRMRIQLPIIQPRPIDKYST